MDGKTIAFVPHATNGATVTLNVDGLGAKPLRSAPGVELPAGVLIAGHALWCGLQQRGGGMDPAGLLRRRRLQHPARRRHGVLRHLGAEQQFAFPFGQALSRTTYAALHALFASAGYPYGSGDGSTTFNLPDLRGRGLFGKDDMGGSAANRITAGGSGITGTALGAAGGAETSR